MTGADLVAIYEYVIDAANDPSFERLIPKPQSPGGARGGAGAPAGAPAALPAPGGNQ